MVVKQWPARFVTFAAGVALFYATTVVAVNFGEITVRSALNQPLFAQIRLENAQEVEMPEVQLASQAVFEQMGVDRQPYLTQLNFSVVKSETETVINVTSEAPVSEPLVNFLVQLQWSSGRILHQYHFALEPFTYSREKPSTISADQAIPDDPESQRPDTIDSATGQVPDHQHRVVAGDTLWNIAKRLRPERATILQTMDALYSENPEAFLLADARKLKKGAILRLPSSVEIDTAAGDRLASQIGLNDSAQPPPAVEHSDLASTSVAEEAVNAAQRDGLSAVMAVGTGDDRTQLASELAMLREQAEKKALENSQLRERLAQLEAQVAALAVQMKEVKKQTKNTSQPRGLTAQLKQLPSYFWAALVGLIVLLIIVLLRVARKNTAHSTDLHGLAKSKQTQPHQEAPAVDTGADLLVDETDGLDLDLETQLFDETERESFVADDSELSSQDFDSLVEPSAEVDIYMSLGDTEKAIETLQKARQADSHDKASRLKLMEILLGEGRDKEAKSIYAEIQATEDQAAVSAAMVMLGLKEPPTDADRESPEQTAHHFTDQLADLVLDEAFLDDESMIGGSGIFAEQHQLPADQEVEVNPISVKFDLVDSYLQANNAQAARGLLHEIINEADEVGQVRARAILEKIDQS